MGSEAKNDGIVGERKQPIPGKGGRWWWFAEKRNRRAHSLSPSAGTCRGSPTLFSDIDTELARCRTAAPTSLAHARAPRTFPECPLTPFDQDTHAHAEAALVLSRLWASG